MKSFCKAFLVLCLFTSLAACEDSTVEFGSVIELEAGQNVVMSDKSVVSLSQINDSRCPTDANCIWEGRADVIIKIVSPQVEDELRLNDVEKATVELNDYRFEFIELTPYPELDTSTKGTLLRFKILLN